MYDITNLVATGSNADRVNIVFLAEGYQQSERTKFLSDAQKFVDYFFAKTGSDAVLVDPIPAYKGYFNADAIFFASNQSGVDSPQKGIYVDTFFNATENQTITRMVYGDQQKANAVLNDAMGWNGYEIPIVLMNSSSIGGAGGNISWVTTGNADAKDTALHEIGHSFARLNDEYIDAAIAPNISLTNLAALNPINVSTSPTTVPWAPWLGYSDSLGTVGVYEGGNYLAQGVWRATKTSKMDNLGQPFNAPQKEAFVLAFYDAIGDYLHIDNSIPGLFVAAVPDPSKVHKAWAANHVASGSYSSFYDAYALGTYQSGTAIEVITTDSSGYVRKGLERTQQQETVQISNAATTRSANAAYTLNTSDTVLCMDAKDNYITLAQGCARNYIDGGAGSDTLVLSGLSANFMLQKLDTGTTVFFDKTGLLSLATTSVEQVQFADKAVALSALGGALTIASALPAVTAHLPPPASAANPVAAWMQAPSQPFPTSQFVALFFDRVWQREATMADMQFWENFVSDYIQQPGQIANVVGLIQANADALLA